MYEIKGIFKEKLGPEGHVIRFKNTFTQHLNTDVGVVRFIQEQKPFSELVVTDLFGKDLTEYFLNEVKKADGKS